MQKIKWGIIGCGNVTEKKSGPAFNKIPGSSLIAVMRRDAEKARDYANRHDGRILAHCDRFTDCLIRLPFFPELTNEQIDEISRTVISVLKS